MGNMIVFKLCHTFFEHFVLVGLHPARTAPHALAKAAGGAERNAAHAVADEVPEEFAAGEAGIAEGEEEAVAHLFVHVPVVCDGESVAAEDLLHPCGAALILADVLHEVNHAVAG